MGCSPLYGPFEDKPNCRALAVGALLLGSVVALSGCATAPWDSGPELADARAAFQRQDYGTAAHLLKPLALQGDADAQYALGYMYYYGRGVPRSLGVALAWFGKAARAGSGRARRAVAALRAQSRLTSSPSAAPGDSGRAGQPPPPSAHSEQIARAKPVHPGSDSAGVVDLRPETHAARVAQRAAVATGAAPAEEPSRPERVRQAKLRRLFTAEPTSAAPARISPTAPGPSPRPAPAGRHCPIEARFTLQLLGSRSRQDLVDLVEQYGIKARTCYIRARYAGGPWYRLLYRGFDSLEAARQALHRLPRGLHQYKPWVRNFPTAHAGALKRFE